MLCAGSALASTSASRAAVRPAAGSVRALAARRRGGHTGCSASSARRHRHHSHACQPTSPRPQRTRRHSSRGRRHAPPEAGSVPATEGPASPSAAAATIATVLATPCQNTELTPEAGNIALVREAVLCLINVKRAENGEAPLAPAAPLEQAAEGHCQELVADDYFAHVSPTGETPVDRIRAAGYIPAPTDGYVIGENLAWGTYQLSTPQSIVAAWIASPGHLANILESQYRQTGIGVVPAVPASLSDGAPGATYAQEFGVIVE